MSAFECPACVSRRMHTSEDWRLHPYRSHGYAVELGWTHPDLEPSRYTVELRSTRLYLEPLKANSLSPACCSTGQTCVSGVKQS